MSQNKEHSKNSENHKYWIAIGASAGGLDAIKNLLQNLSCHKKCYLIVAQHLDPNHPTLLKSLLSKSVDMEFDLINEDTKLKPGIVYIVSPGHNAIIQGERITLSPAAKIGPKPSIDKLFQSLAEEKKEKAIAVILSGTGSDGTQGSLNVRSNEGLVFAQDKDSAKYYGMPDSVISSGAVDLIQSPEEIANTINQYVESAKHKKFLQKKDFISPQLNEIFNILKVNLGHDFTGYKQSTINRRINRRMVFYQVSTIEQYIEILNKNSNEIEALFKDFLISVTEFFRDKESFESLQNHLQTMINEKNLVEVRIWVPGCANGEEAFSIAIILEKIKNESKLNFTYHIFATDIDDTALGYGRKSIYSSSQLENLSNDDLDSFFDKKENEYHIKKYIRDKVVFAKHNIVQDAPFSKMDLISCRNLLIYMAIPLQRKIMRALHFSIKPDGLLFLGKAENAESISSELFKTESSKFKIFSKKEKQISMESFSYNYLPEHLSQAPKEKTKKNANSLNSIHDILLEKLLPTCIIIDSNGEILHTRGDVSRYLKIPEGKFDKKITTLIVNTLKLDILNLISKINKNQEYSSQSFFFDSQNEREHLFITMMPIKNNNLSSNYLISFLKVHTEDTTSPSTQMQNKFDDYNEHLREKDDFFKSKLEASLEELETTNEELQSTNEELQSSNEELQSTNEALQTANEELQSTNQELSTVNQELELKSLELLKTTQEIEELLEYTSESIAIIDEKYRISSYSKNFENTFNSLSHPIMGNVSISRLNLGDLNINPELDVCRLSKEKNYCKFEYEGNTYTLTIIPIQTKKHSINSYFLLFKNTKEVPLKLKNNILQDMFSTLCDHSSSCVLILNSNGIIMYTNNSLEDLLKFTKDSLLNTPSASLLPEPYHSSSDNYFFNLTNEHEEEQRFELTLQTKERERILVKSSIKKLYFLDKVYLVVHINTID